MQIYFACLPAWIKSCSLAYLILQAYNLTLPIMINSILSVSQNHCMTFITIILAYLYILYHLL